MLKLERALVSRLVCRFRSRAVVELENLALVATHNSVCSVNIGVLRRPPYRGCHAYDPVRNGFSGLLPVSASSLSGTGGARSQTSGGRSPSAADRPSEAWSR